MAGLKKSNGNNELDKLVNEIESESQRTLGELEVSEDGLVHDQDLLAGYLDKETGVRHMTFTYREMNGKDEEAIAKAEVRANGAKITNTIVERCVVEIGTLTKKDLGTKKWGELVRNLYSGDLDYMALKIRELSKGTEVEFKHKCPNCKTNLTSIVDTSEFGITDFGGQDEVPFTLPRGYKDSKGVIHREGTIRQMTGLDREIIVPLFKKNYAVATTMLITRLIKFNDGAMVTNDCVSNMSLRDREYLEKEIKGTVFGIESNLELTCSACGEDISGEVGTSNFF